MIDTEQFVQRIHNLALRDPKRRLFGCELHKYELGTCLTDCQLDAFNVAVGIEIPSEYRAFLATVGNGGAGPGYGLESLRPPSNRDSYTSRAMRCKVTDTKGTAIHSAELHDVGANCDFDCSCSTEAAQKSFPLTIPHRSITDQMWNVQIPNWNERLRAENQANKDVFNSIPFGHGVLKIAQYGSGIYAVLVLNGLFRGQVWVSDPHMGDYVPASMRTDLHTSEIKTEDAYGLHKEPFTFNGWYSHWLTSASRELEREYAP